MTKATKRATRLLIFAGIGSLLHAQQSATSLFNRPPDGVEENLRERVSEFYNLQKDGKFRQAEQLVCEDSKDAYYNSKKTRWLSVELLSILFEDEFRTAKVVNALEGEMNIGTGVAKTRLPAATIWKVDGDRWCMFIPPPSNQVSKTPFGDMKRAIANAGSVDPNAKEVRVDQSSVMSGVNLSKQELILKHGKRSSDSLVVENHLPGVVDLQLVEPSMPGLKLHLTQTRLRANEKCTLEATYDPNPEADVSDLQLTLTVEPLSKRIPIRIRFDAPPAK